MCLMSEPPFRIFVFAYSRLLCGLSEIEAKAKPQDLNFPRSPSPGWVSGEGGGGEITIKSPLSLVLISPE